MTKLPESKKFNFSLGNIYCVHKHLQRGPGAKGAENFDPLVGGP